MCPTSPSDKNVGHPSDSSVRLHRPTASSDSIVRQHRPTASLPLALHRNRGGADALANANTGHRETANGHPSERSLQVCPTCPSDKNVGHPSDSIVRQHPSPWRSTGGAFAPVRTRLKGLGPLTRPFACRQAAMCPCGFPTVGHPALSLTCRQTEEK
jgi:hypothetical protein